MLRLVFFYIATAIAVRTHPASRDVACNVSTMVRTVLIDVSTAIQWKNTPPNMARRNLCRLYALMPIPATQNGDKLAPAGGWVRGHVEKF